MAFQTQGPQPWQRKGAEPSGGCQLGTVGKRLQQDLMTLRMSGNNPTL
uniref:Uncharacterized protein n=1 Tax=Panthera tigris altaica TaxID=74533 RepID=A0A8C9M0Z8_PANTA